SINGTIYMRGAPADNDGWHQRGLEGWDWDSVLPYFKKAEDNERGADNWHGAGGPLRVSDVPRPWALPTAMIAAARESGIPANDYFYWPGSGRHRVFSVHCLQTSPLERCQGVSGAVAGAAKPA
ncbi:MAG: GMC family oxidoreductase N-terminal domain-containing protein, partial [Alphaproteobacteria bacterium]